MIIRIVKLRFQEQHLAEFFGIFEASKEKIRNFEGCLRLELLQEKNSPQTIMTYSWWESENHLENYRKSELFQTTWAKTKPLFSEKAAAWSMIQKERLT